MTQSFSAELEYIFTSHQQHLQCPGQLESDKNFINWFLPSALLKVTAHYDLLYNNPCLWGLYKRMLEYLQGHRHIKTAVHIFLAVTWHFFNPSFLLLTALVRDSADRDLWYIIFFKLKFLSLMPFLAPPPCILHCYNIMILSHSHLACELACWLVGL